MAHIFVIDCFRNLIEFEKNSSSKLNYNFSSIFDGTCIARVDISSNVQMFISLRVT